MTKILKTFLLLFALLNAQLLVAQLQLDVDGNARISGKLNLVSTDGTSLFLGTQAGDSDDGTTNNNTFIGTTAGRDNTSGNANTFVGHQAGLQNVVGNNNTYIGKNAGFANKTGGSNTFIGRSAGETNSSGSSNTFVGEDAGKMNIAGNFNTFIGENAGLENVGGSSNTFVGAEAGTANTGGINNSFFGEDAGLANNTGNNNTFIGENTGRMVTSGSSNTFLGQGAGETLVTGDNNIAIGVLANLTNGISNAIAIGDAAASDASNKVVLGNMAATPIGGWDTWTDYGVAGAGLRQRNKGEVKGLDFILKLKPVTYQVDYLKYAEKFYAAGADTIVVGSYRQALIEKSAISQTGFIAKEVERAAEDVGYDFNGVVKPSDKTGTYGLKYGLFTVPLVKAVQELHSGYENLQAENEELKAENQTIRQEVNELKALVQQLITLQNETLSVENRSNTTISKNKAWIATNHPNPFNNSSNITYFVPETAKNAWLQISNVSGQIIQQIPLNKGNGTLKVSARELGTGSFFYTFLVDGQVVDFQQMVVK